MKAANTCLIENEMTQLLVFSPRHAKQFLLPSPLSLCILNRKHLFTLGAAPINKVTWATSTKNSRVWQCCLHMSLRWKFIDVMKTLRMWWKSITTINTYHWDENWSIWWNLIGVKKISLSLKSITDMEINQWDEFGNSIRIHKRQILICLNLISNARS